MGFAALAYIAHPLIEKCHGVAQCGFLARLAGNLVVSAEQGDVDHDHRLAVRSASCHYSAGSGKRAISASRRRFASATRSDSAWLRASALDRPRRSASLAA